MKDKSHHRKFTQKKVIQAVRKFNAANELKTRGELSLLRPARF